MKVGITEAKRKFSALVKSLGDHLQTRKAGCATRFLRTLPAWKGKVRIGPDFDKADKEIEKLFYGE